MPLINKPTRISKNNATIIDHLLTNSFVGCNHITGVIKTDITDHFPVFVITEIKLHSSKKKKILFSLVNLMIKI